jgi:8-oxo-dGTP pyrophosphatase MutT (NUDIX family)
MAERQLHETGKIIVDKWGCPSMPISVKGIVEENGQIWLRHNEWGNWELPGGRLEVDEQPAQTVIREVREELGIETVLGDLIDLYIFQKEFGNNPLIAIATYECMFADRVGELELDGEGGKAEFRLFGPAEALALENLPDVYKIAIQKWHKRRP